MKEVEEFLQKVKKSYDSLAAKHEIRLPAPDKEWAKQNGAKWDDTIKSFVFYSNEPDTHVLNSYIKTSRKWLLITEKMPYDSEGILKKAGVVSEKKDDNQWENYVLDIEKYKELILTLNKMGYL